LREEIFRGNWTSYEGKGEIEDVRGRVTCKGHRHIRFKPGGKTKAKKIFFSRKGSLVNGQGGKKEWGGPVRNSKPRRRETCAIEKKSFF